jgi:hypothetical protein
MPNNGNDWNRNREGSIRERNESDDRFDRICDNDFNDGDNNRNERDFDGQNSNFGGPGYNTNISSCWGTDNGNNPGRDTGDTSRSKVTAK